MGAITGRLVPFSVRVQRCLREPGQRCRVVAEIQSGSWIPDVMTDSRRGAPVERVRLSGGLHLVAQDLTPVDVAEELLVAAGPDELADLELEDRGIDRGDLK